MAKAVHVWVVEASHEMGNFVDAVVLVEYGHLPDLVVDRA